MTDQLMQLLMKSGLSKQQANSVTAQTCVNVLMQEDGKALIKEAQLQVQEMRETVRALKNDYNSFKSQIEEIARMLTAINEAQEEYGKVSDDKAKNVIALYGALLNMGSKFKNLEEQSLENAGYISYAYLGGQARREITAYKKQHNNDDELFNPFDTNDEHSLGRI